MRFQLGLLVLASVLCAGTASASGAGEGGIIAFALTQDQRSIRFPARRPHAARAVGPISGLSGDTRLLGIDFRPATGGLPRIGADAIQTWDALAEELVDGAPGPI